MTDPNCPNCGSNSQHRRTPIATMYAFSDEVLLKIFYHCRPIFSDKQEVEDGSNLEGSQWENQRWWYKLVHVCRKWRCLVLASASHLRLCLLCTYGTPVADMLTYPPAFSLVISYCDEDREVTTQDEEAISLALQRRRRVRRIRLWMPATSLRRLLSTLDGEFPVLENLYIKSLTDDDSLSLPNSFNAPHLRHFALRNMITCAPVFRPPTSILHTSYAEITGQPELYYSPRLWRSLRMFVHILDDDSLLNVFRFYRPVMIDEDEPSDSRTLWGGKWDRERWWYKLAHVCRRWRCLVLSSASHLSLCLVCTRGTPVADMLTNSPPLPLVIDHIHGYNSITAEDEKGIILALQHCHRVHRIRLLMPLLNLEKLVRAVDEEFPILEYLYLATPTKYNSWLILPDTFQAPQLRHFILVNFAFPLRSQAPLGMTNTGLVTLSLTSIPQSAFPHPNDLLQQISLMPQLETLGITFHSPVPKRNLERQLVHTPVTMRATLPHLRRLVLQAASTYMEALLPRMITPLLERLRFYFFFQLSYSIPHLAEFIGAAKNLRFGSARLNFSDSDIHLCVFPNYDAHNYSFATTMSCIHLNWQVSFVAQFFATLRSVFSTVERLTFEFWSYSESSETINDVELSQWRELLGSLSNVKILRVDKDFRGQISRALQVNYGEPLELLPELKELQYSPLYGSGDEFNEFIDARQKTGRPVTLVSY